MQEKIKTKILQKIRKTSWQASKSRYNRKSWKAQGPLVKGLRHRLFTAGNTGSNPVRTMSVIAVKVDRILKKLKNLLTEKNDCDILI